jgi:tetratricopeptide (TPR) repeat protein
MRRGRAFVAGLGLPLGLGAQAVAVGLVLGGGGGGPGRSALAAALALHLGGSAAGTEGLLRSLAGLAGPSRGRAWAALWLTTVFTPVVGLVGVAAALAWLGRQAAALPAPEAIRTLLAEAAPARPRPPAGDPAQSPAGLRGRLAHGRDPGARLRATLATRGMRGREAVAALKQALRDPLDEVRLLAHSLLDEREGEIDRRIRALREELAAADEPARAALHVQLGEEHWELAYQGLVAGEPLRFVLARALEHVEQALAANARSASLILLKGRILLRQGELGRAGAAFEKARELGLPDRLCHPYLAEVAFARRRFGEVRALMEAVRRQEFTHPRVRRLAEHWQ